MAERGHEVTLLTSHPGPPTESVEDGMLVVRAHRPPPVPGMRLHELFLETVPQVIRGLSPGRFDLAHAFYLSSAFAAVSAQRFGGPPVVYSFHGIATRPYLVARRRRLGMLQGVVSAARRTTVLSRAAAESFRRYLFVEPEVLPAGVNLDQFRPEAGRHPQPTVLCTATFTDPRKRIPLLLEAFEGLRAVRPEVRLLIDDNPDPTLRSQRPELPAGAEWVELNGEGALASAYARAWVTVLPSVEEAQGMVLLESLASGTPVAAARSGGPPDILEGHPTAGRLFEPDDADSLVGAMLEALDLAPRPETVAACTARARDFGWDVLLDAHEELYGAALELAA
jgi:glycosyltransferase involved in cell wall biosynthesis